LLPHTPMSQHVICFFLVNSDCISRFQVGFVTASDRVVFLLILTLFKPCSVHTVTDDKGGMIAFYPSILLLWYRFKVGMVHGPVG
jgi:hypothetical protein